MNGQIAWLGKVISASLRLNLVFRASWILDVTSRLVQFFLTIVFFDLLYAGQQSLGDVPWGTMLIIIGTYQAIRAVSDTIFAEVNRISDKVEGGDLDFDLLKPIGTRLLVSIGKVRTPRLLELLMSITIVVVGLGRNPGWAVWVWFAFMILVGSWIKYCLCFLLNSVSFWIVQTYGLYGLFDQLFDLARYPTSAFRGLVRQLLVSIMPVALVANTPARGLLEGPSMLATIVLILQAIIWYLLGNLVWRAGLRRYESATS